MSLTSVPTPPGPSGLLDLGGRVAVVTGGARGIGLAICRRLAGAGARLLLADLAGAREAAASLLDEGLAVTAADLDVTDQTSVAAVRARALDELGGVDIWVNNAGIYPTSGPFITADPAVMRDILTVNVEGTVNAAQAAAGAMGRGGVIVNIASVTAFRAGPGVAAYAASKGAVVVLTRNLARELGPSGIRVMAVAPGMVRTPGLEAERAALGQTGTPIDKVVRANPLAIEVQPDHIARAVLFAVSPLAEAMTGTTLVVDGGLTL